LEVIPPSGTTGKLELVLAQFRAVRQHVGVDLDDAAGTVEHLDS
jgi:hypothetical protein